VSNVSILHEAPLEVLRQAPQAVLSLLQLAGVAMKERLRVEVLDTELADAIPTVRRADFVASTCNADGSLERVVVVEVQRDRDLQKPQAWLEYIAYLTRKHAVTVTLLVLTFDSEIAAWARQKHPVGTNATLEPWTFGPEDLPEIPSVEAALANPELALLTALTRLSSRTFATNETELVRVFEAVLRNDDEPRKRLYLSLLHGVARPAIRSILEEFMEEYGMSVLEMIREEGREEGQTKGIAKGKAEAVLQVLVARGLAVDARLEAQVRATQDLAQLDHLLTRAAVATSANEILGE
jgi:hypothetical protein